MSDTETVQEDVQEQQPHIEEAVQEQPQEIVGQPQEQEEPAVEKEQHVPLSALQKERKKRQEAEQRNRLYEEMQAQALRDRQQSETQPQEDETQYEAVTKGELASYEKKLMQQMEEKSWMRQNPEKTAEIHEKLTDFLNQRPNLKFAIEVAPNRYEEAWNLMNALTPKQKLALKPNAQIKKEAPGSPNALPKATGMNQAIDLMSMNDSEFLQWRKAQKASARR